LLPSATSSQIKTRLQKQKPRPDGSLPYAGFVDCARKIAQAEGTGAFYKVRERAQGARLLLLRVALDLRGAGLRALLLSLPPCPSPIGGCPPSSSLSAGSEHLHRAHCSPRHHHPHGPGRPEWGCAQVRHAAPAPIARRSSADGGRVRMHVAALTHV